MPCNCLLQRTHSGDCVKHRLSVSMIVGKVRRCSLVNDFNVVLTEGVYACIHFHGLHLCGDCGSVFHVVYLVREQSECVCV